MRIAVDAWGGDFAPREILLGLKEARSSHDDLLVLGPRDKLGSLYSEMSMDEADFPIVDAPQIIEMDEDPTRAIRRKPNAGITLGVRLMSEGKTEAFISAGNSGAVMTAAWIGLRRIGEIERPAIAVLIPSHNSYTVVLDVGANMDCKPKHLLHFGIMGAEYARIVLGIDRPRVGLLSIGEEEGKGNEVVKAAYQLYKDRREHFRFDFTGNAEGQDIVNGKIDVAVCDGFTGNVLLKFGEGLIELIFQRVSRELAGTLQEERIRHVWKKLDRSEYGGALLLGVEGICMICHGKSKARDIHSAIRKAKDLADQGIVKKIRTSLTSLEA
ncbi:MAG TPA: phosphate acyltransferase PlsX [Atribacteraceae bacterium]|nr:phosphate acyltransferase PlsX [Atribacteraceae bacterium]